MTGGFNSPQKKFWFHISKAGIILIPACFFGIKRVSLVKINKKDDNNSKNLDG